MDIRAIRANLATVAASAGFNSWDFPPDDPMDYPAAVVGGLRRYFRHNRIVTEIDLVVTLYSNAADPKDGTAVLDKALSVGTGESYIDAIDAASVSSDKPAWSSLRFAGAGPYNRYSMPGGLAAFGVEIVLTVTG